MDRIKKLPWKIGEYTIIVFKAKYLSGGSQDVIFDMKTTRINFEKKYGKLQPL